MLSSCGSWLDNAWVPLLGTAVVPGPEVCVACYLVSQQLRVDALERAGQVHYLLLNAPSHSGSWCCLSFQEFVQTDGPLWTPLS